jgi:hypothetical protein
VHKKAIFLSDAAQILKILTHCSKYTESRIFFLPLSLYREM